MGGFGSRQQGAGEREASLVPASSPLPPLDSTAATQHTTPAPGTGAGLGSTGLAPGTAREDQEQQSFVGGAGAPPARGRARFSESPEDGMAFKPEEAHLRSGLGGGVPAGVPVGVPEAVREAPNGGPLPRGRKRMRAARGRGAGRGRDEVQGLESEEEEGEEEEDEEREEGEGDSEGEPSGDASADEGAAPSGAPVLQHLQVSPSSDLQKLQVSLCSQILAHLQAPSGGCPACTAHDRSAGRPVIPALPAEGLCGRIYVLRKKKSHSWKLMLLQSCFLQGRFFAEYRE